MGIDTATANFLCAAKSSGVDFETTLTLGRQCLYPWLLDSLALQRIFDYLRNGLRADEFIRQNWYADPFFLELGAHTVDSMDVSWYESPTMIHDLNMPMPTEWKQRFSVVFDGGTIEHVFNIPQALKNSMQMVRIGGHFLGSNMANNYMGHGFWQLSPELMFRVFSWDNGFQIKAVLLHEVSPRGCWYVVSDPDEIRSRVELCNSRPTLIFTIAQRVADREIFSTPPMQSDYVALWKESQQTVSPASPDPKGAQVGLGMDVPGIDWRRFVPSLLKRPLRSARYRARSARESIGKSIKSAVSKPTVVRAASFNQNCYHAISEYDLIRGNFTPAPPGRVRAFQA